MIHYDAQRPASLDVILDYLGISEDEFNNIALDHQVFPHVHNAELTPNAQSKVPDHDQWERRLKTNHANPANDGK